MKEKFPFTTSNRTLAIALHVGGCRILDIWRLYPTDAAAAADERGRTVFMIEDGPNRAELEQAFDSVAECEKADLPSVSNADAAKLAHLVLQCRAQIVDWLRNPASAMVGSENGAPTSYRQEDGSIVVQHPGFKAYSAGARQSIRDYLKS